MWGNSQFHDTWNHLQCRDSCQEDCSQWFVLQRLWRISIKSDARLIRFKIHESATFEPFNKQPVTGATMQYQTIGLIFWGTLAGALILTVLSVISFGVKQRTVSMMERLEFFIRSISPPVRVKVPVAKVVGRVDNSQHPRWKSLNR